MSICVNLALEVRNGEVSHASKEKRQHPAIHQRIREGFFALSEKWVRRTRQEPRRVIQ